VEGEDADIGVGVEGEDADIGVGVEGEDADIGVGNGAPLYLNPVFMWN